VCFLAFWPKIATESTSEQGLTGRLVVLCFQHSQEWVIPGLLDEDPSVGLAAKLGLVSEECAFICNDCTAGLIDARLVARSGTARAR
jgi:hypothetical protein